MLFSRTVPLVVAALAMSVGVSRADTIIRGVCIAGIAGKTGQVNFSAKVCDENFENCVDDGALSVENITPGYSFRPTIAGMQAEGDINDPDDSKWFVIVNFDASYVPGYQEKRYTLPARRAYMGDCSLLPNYHFAEVAGGVELYKGCSPVQSTECWY
ncbi:hypothetical protein [Mesorhizobium sp. B2-3-4]|uniref:hypothetical protein n=1 Tax=Mesorhizobium sp. B2-3-4 TaxID=2589959 RepID=UPI00112A021A|nr:hypothetical protein [Mesorhizobium sp. B2-3-4]TPM30863.1 hypothetical protein FJ967_25720 [Mesorhizobium sp. B2-3-4]